MPGTSLSAELEQFSQYLETNYAPSDDEIQRISGLLEDPTAKLATLTEEIEELRKSLDEKENDHDALQSKIKEYRCLVTSPIRRLPDDILREIFVRCLPRDHPTPMHNTFAPMLLMAICSRWRDIAISTPHLWASIHIPVPNPRPHYYIENQTEVDEQRRITSEAVKKRVVAVEEWLGRSGACPLDISFYCFNSFDATHNEQIFSAINKFSARWTTLKLSCPAYCLGAVAHLTASEVPLLESLTIIGEGGHGYQARPFLWKDCGILQAPNLRKVSFSQVSEDTTAFPLRWSQLTTLTLCTFGPSTDPPTPLRLFTIMSQCVNLVSCRMELPYMPPFPASTQDVEPPSVDQIISLPILKNLALNDGGTDITAFIAKLDLPSLQDLEFFGGTQWTNAPGTKLTLLLSRTSSTLRRFTTDSKLYIGDDFLTCLKLSPRLVSLSLKNVPSHTIPHQGASYVQMDDQFLSQFTTPNEEGEYLCPLLEEFECLTKSTFTDPGIYQFIEYRQSMDTPGVAKLKRVAISFNRRRVVEPGEEIQNFTSQGLVLDLSYVDSHFSRNQFSTLDGLDLPYFAFPRNYDFDDF